MQCGCWYTVTTSKDGAGGRVAKGQGEGEGEGEGEGLWRREPQSAQSLPRLQRSYSLPGPPSSQYKSDAQSMQLLVQSSPLSATGEGVCSLSFLGLGMGNRTGVGDHDGTGENVGIGDEGSNSSSLPTWSSQKQPLKPLPRQ